MPEKSIRLWQRDTRNIGKRRNGRGGRSRLLRATVAAIFIASPLAAEQMSCSDIALSVTGGEETDRSRICTVASNTMEQFAGCGIRLDRHIDVEIVESIETAFRPCVGVFHCSEDRIEILSPPSLSVARDRKGAFSLLSDDAYWDSILVHELAHAAYESVPCPFTECVTTSEYVAYTMQIQSLPENERELFGKTVILRSEPSREAISKLILFMSPDHFAKFSWLHFEKLDTPCEYMRGVMDGKIFFDREHL